MPAWALGPPGLLREASGMDFLSILGLGLAMAAIVFGQALEGGHLTALINGPAFVIVIGGTLGAVLLQTPMFIFKRALQRSVWVFVPPEFSLEPLIRKICDWSNVARKEGLLGLEKFIEGESDSFCAKALQLLVDGSEPEQIRHALEMELSAREDIDEQAARLFESMGGYAPTIGIIGAVLGLIHVMENLADPSKLGPGIAAAFVATVYGVGIANLICLPLGNKLKSLVRQQSRVKEIIIEGIIAIAQGENPRAIESRLQGFIQH
jgi:chemotaxis protein MotA